MSGAKGSFRLLLVAIVLGTPGAAARAGSPEVTLRDTGGVAQLRVMRETGVVTLELVRPPRSAGAVELTYRRPDGRSITVALQSLSPTRFTGTLPVAQASFVGAELRIPLRRDRKETIRLRERE